MKIKELHIHNFKGFVERSFQLNEQFTVLIGENATGKTSILDALAVALGAFMNEIQLKNRKIDKREIHTLYIDDQPRPQLPVQVRVTGELDQISLSWVVGINQKTSNFFEAKQLRAVFRDLLKMSRAGGRPIFPLIAYHGTGRLWVDHEKIGFQKQEEGVKMAYINCLSAKSSSKEFLQWFKTQDDTILKFDRKLEKAHFQAFKNTIIDMIPENRWHDFHFDHKLNQLVGIFTDANGQAQYLKYSQLSDGFRNLIGLAADLAYRCIQLNPHLGLQAVKETPGMVLIDELDLHLHPNWQRRVVADLKRVFPRVQFVATTHSPFIVQSLQSDELINLDQISETLPQDLSINDISTLFMGVDSEFSTDNEHQKNQSKAILEGIEKGENVMEMTESVSNPAVRAFLELKQMAQNTK
jgi:predicted ATP-binding protein involved in virulence